jgi:hypothetical protein
MPLYEQLVRRAIAAQVEAHLLKRDSERIRNLAQLLREADARQVMLLRCAWCDRYRVGHEWLHLEAVGRGEQRIRSSLRDGASHGICPRCLDEQLGRRFSAAAPSALS